jgi:DNA-directed RNA polymerase specialized sigma24 family protein
MYSPVLYLTFSTYMQLGNYKDTAEDNNILLDTVKTRILRARKFLKKDLPEDFVALIQN